MTTAWVAAFSGLALVVTLIAVLLLGLIRRDIDVMSRVETTLASFSVSDGPPKPTGLCEGDAAPALDARHEAALVVFLDTGCDPCQALAADIRRHRFTPAHHQPIAVMDHPEGFPDPPLPTGWTVVPDPDHRVATSWRVTGTPDAFAVDDLGTIRGRDFANTTKDLRRLLAPQQAPEPRPIPQEVNPRR